jgi:hypothetical protein
MPALICLWPKPEDYFTLRLDRLVRKRGLLSSSLAVSGSLMLSEARTIFHSFVVQSEAPMFGLAIIMASIVAGRDFLGAEVLVRLVADLAVFLRRLVVVVVDDGLTFAAGMNIPIGDTRVCALPSPIREVS